MSTFKNPKWWTAQNDSAWERIKAAFKRDWDQTKHDFGGDEPDTDQDVNNTVKQAAGKEGIPPRGTRTYEEVEQAHRFGYGARSYYGDKYPAWNSELESRLESDWRNTYPSRGEQWDEDVEDIRRGWDYDDAKSERNAPASRSSFNR
jgi:hypothetical protein